MHSVIGLSFSENRVQAVEVESDGGQHTLRALEEWEHHPDLGDQVAAFLRRTGVTAKSVAVALDTPSLFINTIPMDGDLSRGQIDEQLRWELGQYFPDVSPEDFVVDYHVFSEEEVATHILCVCVRRERIRELKKELARAGLLLRIVDVDHFAADNVLRANYPDAAAKRIALVGIKAHRLDVSLLIDGTLRRYYYHTPSSDGEIIEAMAALPVHRLDLAVVYGEHLNTKLLADIQASTAMVVEVLNPLRHIAVAEKLRLTHQFTRLPYDYAPAIGVAIRSS